VSGKTRKNIFILSFDPDVIMHAVNSTGAWKYVLNLKDPNKFTNKLSEYLPYLYGVCVPIKNLTHSFTRKIQTSGKKIMTYSCNIPVQLSRVMKINPDVIMTDRPRWLITRIEESVQFKTIRNR